ncbi:MAG: transglutaminase domain-containing protein [Flavobacteriaceae bacterium]
MIKLICGISIFVFCFTQSSAQEIKFGNVSKEELLEKEYPNDQSAGAVILFKKKNTYLLSSVVDNKLITEVHERIKIYKNDGFEYATEEINLFKTRSSEEGVNKIKAVTYNLENDQIVTTELKKDEIFETEASYNYNQVKFTLPNVKAGSIIEFSYKITSPFIWNIDEFRFQYDIPVKRMEAEIRTPKGFNFKQTFKGYYNVYPKTSTKRDHRIDMNVVINEYVINNMPAMKAENYVDNINNYRSGVIYELVSVELPGYFKSYSQSWADVAKTIGSSDDYKNQLDKTRSFDDEVDAIIGDSATEIDKMKSIFEYIKDNITWNGVDGKYFYYGLKKTLKEKKGNAADINLLLVAMLRYAGINANPVIISTKENLIPFFPTIDRLNYVLAYAVIDDKQYFMDATEEFSNLNVLPIKDYNWKGILIDNNKKVWKQIDILSPGNSSSLYAMNISLNEDGSEEGSCKSRFDKHSALQFRKKYKGQDMDDYLAEKESRYSGIEIDNYEVKNTDTYQGNVNESFNFYNDSGADLINDKLYVKPLGFLSMDENPFKSEKREYPIDFGYPIKDMYMVSLNIPEGYKVESIPSPTMVSLPDNLGVFRYSITQVNAKINIAVNLEINKASISPTYYPHLKEFFNQIIIKESEQLILGKI